MTRPGMRKERLHRAVVAVLFLAILAFALYARTCRLGEEGLNNDEVATLRGLYESSFSDAFRATRELDPPMTPVYFLVQYAWSRAAGITVARMHLLSVLFCAATLAAVFFAGRKLSGSRAGLVAMLLLAASPMHAYYSLEIRNYSLTALLGVLSLITLLRGVERPSRRRWLLNLSVDLLLGMSHLFANLLFVPQAIFLLLCHRRRAVLVPWLLSHAVIAAAVAAWLITCDFAAIGRASAYIGPLSPKQGVDMLLSLAGAAYYWGSYGMIARPGPAGWLMAGLFTAAPFLLAAAWFLRNVSARADRVEGGPVFGQGAVLATLCVFLPPLLLAGVSVGYANCFLPRYVLCSAVAAPLMVACALTAFRSLPLRVVTGVALAVACVSLLVQTVQTRPQRSFQGPLCRTLKEGVRPGDRLVLLPPYAGRFASEMEMLAPAVETVRKAAWLPCDHGELAERRAAGMQTWLVNWPDPGRETAFEAALNASGLPFVKHAFQNGIPLLYRIPFQEVELVVEDGSVAAAQLGSGRLRGWFAADRLGQANGVGLVRLVSADHPFYAVFARPSLALREVCDALPDGTWRARDMAQAGPVTLRVDPPAVAEARWTSRAPQGAVDLGVRYVFSGQNAVDVFFEATPVAGAEFHAPVRFTFASSIDGACSPEIHFPVMRDGAECWMKCGDGIVGQDAAAAFSVPVFYGLVEGNENGTAGGDAMALILMFDQSENIRFAVAAATGEPPLPEWSWQYVLPAPEPGRTEKRRARLVCKPFVGEEDVLAEYLAWRAGLAVAAELSPAPPVAVPVFPGPGGEGCDLAPVVDALAEVDAEQALAAWVALLEIPLYRTIAAQSIDAAFIETGDRAGRVAAWEGIAARDGRDALPLERLGAARAAAGDAARASEAFARALRLEPRNRGCLMGLAAVRLEEGNTGEVLELANAAVAAHPDLAAQAAALCGAAARRRLSAGDVTGAEAAFRAALRHVPGDVSAKIPLGRLLVDRGETAAGLALLNEVIAAMPQLRGPLAEPLAAAADLCLKAGDAQGAAMVFRRALDLAPDACQNAVALGGTLEEAGDRTGAEAAYREALQCDPGHVPAKIRLGALLIARGETNGGLALIAEAVAAETAGDSAAARAHAAAKRTMAAEACAQAAKARMADGDAAGAAAALRRAVELTPDATGCQFDLAVALEAAGDSAGALDAYRAVVLAVPESPRSAARIDALLDMAGGAAARVAEWKRIVAAHPDAAVPQLHLGLALEAAGDATGAEAAYRDALARNPKLDADSARFNRVKGAVEGAP